MFYDEKLVLLTGASGFIGSNYLEELSGRGANIRYVTNQRPVNEELDVMRASNLEHVVADLRLPEECARVMEGVDYVIHCAGAVANPATVNSSLQVITDNLALTGNILGAAWKAGVTKLLMNGSHTGYPDIRKPMVEDEYYVDDPHPTYYGYGHMRRYLERMVDFTSEQSGMNIITIRPSGVYGRFDNFNPKTCHVIPALINRAIQKVEPFDVWGRGDIVRDFLYADDLARGGMDLFEQTNETISVNLANGEIFTIDDVAKAILKATGHDAEIVYDETKPTTIPYRALDISLAEKLVNFAPHVSLEEGIGRTVDHYLGGLWTF